MSRSLHTQRLANRAQRRLARPYSKRRHEAGYLSGRNGDATAADPGYAPIEAHKTLPRMRHAVTAREVRALLETLGPAASYGLKSIRFRKEAALRAEGIVFAEYAVSGHIDLFALPESPWWLPFLLDSADAATFENYGARIEIDVAMAATSVRWRAADLTRFILTEVLAHELGHHLFQYHKGKRSAKLSRRADHERRADLHSRRVRRLMARAAGPA